VVVTATPHETHVTLEIVIARTDQRARAAERQPLTDNDRDQLEPARQLLVSASGGLEVERDDERGEVLRVVLPVAQRTTVLVVDDNPELLQLFQRFLNGLPYQVVLANSSAQAVDLAQRARPQVITLDLMMPMQDGWELLQLLKNLPETRQV